MYIIQHISAELTSTRPPTPWLFRAENTEYNGSLITSDNCNWRKMRKFAITSLRDFGFGNGYSTTILICTMQERNFLNARYTKNVTP